MNRLLLFSTLLGLPALTHAVEFQKDITPLFKTYCYKCHSEAEKKEKGKLVLDNTTRLGQKIDGKVITAGDPDKSSMFKTLALPADDDDHMPPAKEKQMKPAEIAMIKQWIADGAKFQGGGGGAPAPAAAAAGGMGMGMDAAPAAGGVQTWTNAAGASIKATLLRVEGDKVVLQRDDGQCFILPIASLSAESQAQAKK